MSQINESDTLNFQLRGSLSGNYQRGNVNVFTLRTKLDFSKKLLSNFVFKSQNNSLYQEFSQKKADNDIFSRNYLYFKPENKFYPFAIAYISTNYRRKIDFRYFAGAGLTYQLIANKKNTLKLSESIVYEETKFNTTSFNFPEYNGDNTINVWRNTLYLAGWHKLFDGKIKLFYDGYYQPAFSKMENFRTQFDIGIEIPIWKGLAFTSLFTQTRENVVSLTNRQIDENLTFGLSYSFKN